MGGILFRLARPVRRAIRLYRLAPCRGVHVSIANRGGSVQHYHHFLLGFLVPLVHAWPDLVAAAKGGQVHIRSCAVMDPLLRALNREALTVLDLADHAALRPRRRSLRLRHNVDGVTLHGFDTPPTYDSVVFTAARDRLFQWLAPEIATERAAVAALFPGSGPRILMIDRLPPDPFYNSPHSESRSAGSQRRSIPNMAALHHAAQTRSGNAALVTLEGRSLPFQMALFASADTIICQHGAALANLLWTRPGTRVIEIIPAAYLVPGALPDFFGALCDCLALRHDRLIQDSKHSSVDPGALALLLGQPPGGN